MVSSYVFWDVWNNGNTGNRSLRSIRVFNNEYSPISLQLSLNDNFTKSYWVNLCYNMGKKVSYKLRVPVASVYYDITGFAWLTSNFELLYLI